MAAKTAQAETRKTHWTATAPDEATQPKGSTESLHRAVEQLGPFRHKLCEDADNFMPEGLGGRRAISEELAFGQVFTLATDYNRKVFLDQNAPRAVNVVNHLCELESLTAELAAFLESLDDITLQRLQTAGSGVGLFSKFVEYPLMDEADAAGLPLPSDWEQDGRTASRWIQRLKALSQYANATANNFLLTEGRTADDVDKGGNRNAFKSLYGAASWGLVHQGWHTFDLFNKDATGTEGGPFHLFLMDVFEYATGLDPEQHSKLSRWLKSQCRVNRRYKEIVARQRALEKEDDKIEKARLRREPEAIARYEQLRNEFFALERERSELWKSVYPFAYPDHTARS